MELDKRRLIVAEQRQKGEVTRYHSKIMQELGKQAKIQALKHEEHERREELLFVRRQIRDQNVKIVKTQRNHRQRLHSQEDGHKEVLVNNDFISRGGEPSKKDSKKEYNDGTVVVSTTAEPGLDNNG